MESQVYILGSIGAVLMGMSLGVFGAGGSILTVPLLVYIFGFSASSATHSSLFVVGVVSAIGVLRDRQKGGLPIGGLIAFALPAMAGMYLVRSWILPALPQTIFLSQELQLSLDALILGVFALFMISASLSMIFLKVKNESVAELGFIRMAALVGTGFFVGLGTGFVGAGGGFLIVPALVFLAGFPVKEATRGSLLVILLNSLFGFFVSAVPLAEVPWLTLVLLVITAGVGMILGLQVKHLVPADKLKPGFGVFVLLMGAYVLGRTLL